MTAKHPTILWAQRSANVYLSVEVGGMKIDELSVDGDNFKIKGSKGDETYQADLTLYGKLKVDELRRVATDRRIELIIPKEIVEWWPRLLHEKSKVAWIKVDFDKWVDEDEESGVGDDDSLGMDGLGMPGMDGMSMPGMDGLGMPGMDGMEISNMDLPADAGSDKGFWIRQDNHIGNGGGDDDSGELENDEITGGKSTITDASTIG